MTVLHKDEHASLKGLMSESHQCVDCGFNTAPGWPPRELAEYLMSRDGGCSLTLTPDAEVYIVKDSVWEATGLASYGGCLCVGSLERRIGRKLNTKDFVRNHPFNSPDMPCSERLWERRTKGRKD
jgi:hypothetical protein